MPLNKHFIAAVILLAASLPCLRTFAQHPNRKPTAGNGPDGVQQTTFLVHRLGSDHAEGITSVDMNGDGHPDLLSGSYWYENPGPNGGEWKRHQYRTVEIVGEFVSDCGEWVIDVNHDGAPDIVTAGWMLNGVWWYENPGKNAAPGTLWQAHFITDSFDTDVRGRLIQSLKSHLSARILTGTEIFGRQYRLEDLVARILTSANYPSA